MSRSLITGQVPAMFNGVSQQPETMRLPSQAEAQVNMLSTVTRGVGKRPPTQWLKKITTATWDSAKFHTVNRDTGNRFSVVLDGEDVFVNDLSDGTALTVSADFKSTWAVATAYVVDDVVHPTTKNGYVYRCTVAGTSHASVEPTWPLLVLYDTVTDGTATWEMVPDYLDADDPENDFVLVTVADYTFIVNKTVRVTEKDQPTAEPGNYNGWYRPAIWRYGYTAADFYNDQGGGTLDGTVQTFTDLPTTPNLNDYYRVEGYDADSFGSYYVRYNGSNVWEETYGPDANQTLDDLVMPHVLVDNLDGTFDIKPFTWLPRRFGDVETNPSPTFVNGYLKEVFFYKNRLGLLSDENVVFSGAGDFGNFYRNTVTAVIDSDVVDVAVSTSRVSKLRYAVPFNNGLMLFADQTQFRLNVDQILTPSSVSIDEVTAFETDINVEPVSVNSEVYFVTRNGNYSRIYEYYVADDVNITEAADITAHVPALLPSDLKMMTGSSNDDILLALPDSAGTLDNRIYVYKFRWQGDEKVMSSWSYWDFSVYNTILSISCMENVVYVLTKRVDGVHLEKIDLETNAVAESLTHDILLDQRTTRAAANMTYDGGTNKTTVTLPYEVSAGDQAEFYFIYEDRTSYEGVPVVSPASQMTWNSTTEVVLFNGDYTSYTLICGVNYESEYQFSQLFNSDQNGIAKTTGRTQVRTMTVYYEDANFFQTEVDPYGKNSPGQEDVHPQFMWSFSGKTLGDGGLYLNTPQFLEGEYQFSIGGDSRQISIKLRNDYPYQARFQSAEWEALYWNRAR
jgi:hypothetical protein